MATAKEGSEELYDLLVVVDATFSMRAYLESLQTSLPQITSISTLTDCFSRLGILAYRDYAATELLDWSGWLAPSSKADETTVDLIKSVKALRTGAGGDWPEATKTGLARAYELMRPEATTIILLYADAPPHTFANGSMTDTRSSYLMHEQKALKETDSYGGFGPKFLDWVSSAKALSGRHGSKKAQVFSILQRNMSFSDAGYYNYLSTITGGACFYLNDSQPASISKVTVEVLLAWMGAEKAGADASVEFPAYLTRYISIHDLKNLKDENDPAANPFFHTLPSKTYRSAGDANITKIRLSSDILKRHLPNKKTTSVKDFAKRYGADERYKNIAVEHLRKIIQDDVTAISLNPVFGSLWRAVCNDRANEMREELASAFGLQVDRISDAGEKTRMKTWLEESYDYTAEVLETITSVPEAQRFPCVCLDPTLVFSREIEDNEDESDDKPITSFKRDELLEIGRSCDYRILRRLGRVLTRLTYITSAEEMPAHIAAASETEIPRIPMALAAGKHKRKFWRILLHIVVPGTMLSSRPAALLAALSIRLGIQPLLEAAEEEMLLWPDRWNDIEIPENWNVSCLSLLLDADDGYRKRHQKETTSLLKNEDRALFERLVSYKILELNLHTTLTARIGWTPEKTTLPIGPVIICRSCEYPRSVTIMGAQGKCGHCLWTDDASPEDRKKRITTRVSKADNETTPAIWVECNIRTCRAQYVVYHPEALNVKPKCHYCRQSSIAPTVECTSCLNRIIYPPTYRPTKQMKDFKCYACKDGHKTTVSIETTANKLSTENGNEWLLENKDQKIIEPFNKRSLFHTIAAAGTQNFCSQVTLFPSNVKSTNDFKLYGKLIRNFPSLTQELKSWVQRRRTESGTCSLCFSDFRKDSLNLACGRSGCSQRICKDCLQGWYGLNAVGRIINTAALSCPFCRRAPAGRTLAKYGMGIHAVGNLQSAANEKGEWIFAWCVKCGHAKRYMERVCALGAPAELSEWQCEGCTVVDIDDEVEELKVKMCPGCGVATEKISGCDHIECESCRTHWCWYCGGKSTEGEIYAHMQSEHGGYYGGDEYDTDDGDDTGY